MPNTYRNNGGTLRALFDARARAAEAGLDGDTVDAVGQAAMAEFDPGLTKDEWLKKVDRVIVEHAQP